MQMHKNKLALRAACMFCRPVNYPSSNPFACRTKTRKSIKINRIENTYETERECELHIPHAHTFPLEGSPKVLSSASPPPLISSHLSISFAGRALPLGWATPHFCPSHPFPYPKSPPIPTPPSPPPPPPPPPTTTRPCLPFLLHW